MKKLVALFALAAVPAMAHPGHVLFEAGHDHWFVAAGIALIIVAGLVALKRRS